MDENFDTRIMYRHNVATLRAVTANYSGIIWSVDRKGNITLFDGLYLKELGVTPDFLEGKNIELARHKERHLDVIENIQKTFTEGPQDWISETDGKMFHIRTAPIYDGNGDITGVVGSANDVTEALKREKDFLYVSKQNEIQLAKLNLAVKATNVGLWDMEVAQEAPVNPENTFNWSDDFRQMLGFSNESEFPNLLCSWSNRLHPDDKERVLESFEKHLEDKTGKTPYDVEYRLLTKSGEYRYFRASGETIRDGVGNPIRVAGTLMDVTETKQAEKTLKNALDESKKALEALAHREELLRAVNRAASVLLAAEDEETLEIAIAESLELIGRSIDADRAHLWRNETIDGDFCHVNAYDWIRDEEKERCFIQIGAKVSYTATPEWKDKFLRNEHFNGPVSGMTQNEQDHLLPFGVKSIAAIPLFLNEQFWGWFCIVDSIKERTFTASEIDILRSVGFMMLSAINRLSLTAEVKKALDETKETLGALEDREKLLHAVNRAVSVLLTADENESIEALLTESLELIGHTVDADRVQIWQNKTINGELHYTHAYFWQSEEGKHKEVTSEDLKFPYKDYPEWERRFLRNEYISEPLSEMPKEYRDFLGSYGIRSIVMIPLFLNEQFWGFFSVEDCVKDRTFTTKEIHILRSVGSMIISTLNRFSLTEEIRKANDYAKILLDSTPMSCQLYNSSFKKIDCNQEAIRMFGFKDKQDFFERSPNLYPEFQPCGERSTEKVARHLKQAVSDGSCTFEWTYRMFDGTIMPAEATLVRVKYGDDYVIAGYVRDLREHNKMMQEIEYGENLLRAVNHISALLLKSDTETFEDALLQSMKTIGEAVDVDRVYIWKNYMVDGDKRLYCEQVYEWSERVEPQHGKKYTYGVSYRDDIPRWKEELSKGNCINDIIRDVPPKERELLSPQGIVSILAVPIFVEEQFWGFVGVDDCNNERVFTAEEEASLRSGGLLFASALLRNEMVANIRDSAARLEMAYMEAEIANKAKSDFLSMVSHEIRTPMNAILGIAEIQLQKKSLAPETQEALAKIHNAGNLLLGIINDVLDLSKIEAGKLELAPAEYDVASLISDVATLNMMRIGSKRVAFDVSVDENMPTVLLGDEIRIKQILNNLLSNAFKYTKEGEVTLSISVESSNDDNVVLIFEVRDTGLGMTEDQVSKLFEKYTRFNTRANREIEGIGLGMNITRSLVSLMNGAIFVKSKPNEGSIFTVRLCQKRINGSVLGKELAGNLKNFNTKGIKQMKAAQIVYESMPYGSVLIVDDVESNLYVATGLLSPYGLSTETATSGYEAIDKIKEGNVYDIVFMDHMMPGMDGIETVQIIRELGYTEPIVALTANALAGQDEMFYAHGFDGFISKPIDVRHLNTVLKKFIRDKHAPSAIKSANGEENSNGKERQECVEDEAEQLTDNPLLIEAVLKDIHNALATLTTIHEKGVYDDTDRRSYGIYVHGTKSALMNIGAQKLSAFAAKLEKAERENDIATIKSETSVFLDRLNRLVERLTVSKS